MKVFVVTIGEPTRRGSRPLFTKTITTETGDHTSVKNHFCKLYRDLNVSVAEAENLEPVEPVAKPNVVGGPPKAVRVFSFSNVRSPLNEEEAKAFQVAKEAVDTAQGELDKLVSEIRSRFSMKPWIDYIEEFKIEDSRKPVALVTFRPKFAIFWKDVYGAEVPE